MCNKKSSVWKLKRMLRPAMSFSRCWKKQGSGRGMWWLICVSLCCYLLGSHDHACIVSGWLSFWNTIDICINSPDWFDVLIFLFCRSWTLLPMVCHLGNLCQKPLNRIASVPLKRIVIIGPQSHSCGSCSNINTGSLKGIIFLYEDKAHRNCFSPQAPPQDYKCCHWWAFIQSP